MRQVPHYLIIGNGRLAQHLLHYFKQLALAVDQWSRQNTLSSFHHKLTSSSHVLLLIPDACIDDFIAEHTALLADKTLLHCSGSHLSAHARTAHPLMSFSLPGNKGFYSNERYRSIPFIVEQEGPTFFELLPGIPNPHYSIPRAKKPYYHSLCVMANNFTCVLWQKFFDALSEDLNIPTRAGLPFLEQTADNIKQNYHAALTGPLVRGDTVTLQKNLNALEKDPFQPVFQAFINLKTQENKKSKQKKGKPLSS